jgi:hypothetical protein
MASGSFNLTRTSGSSYVSFPCYWSSAPNTNGNYSDVALSVYIAKGSGSTSNTWGTTNTTGTVDGQTQYENGLAFSVAPGGSTLIFAKSYRVYHNADGSKNIGISVNVGGDVATGSGSVTVALDKIPRQANITAAPNFNDEENPTINYSNPAGNAVTSLKACIANVGGSVVYAAYRDIPKTGSSYTFNLTDEERKALINACLNSNSMKVRFYVTTVIGSNTYYSTLDKTLTIVNAMPEIVVSAKDVGAASKLLTGDENKIIKGFNYVLSSMSSTLKKGATIKSQSIFNGSQSLIGEAGGTASMEGGFNNAESDTFIFGLTDSRGNTVNKYITLEMIDYIKLTCNLDTKNPTADGNMAFKISGNYFNGNFGAVANTLDVAFRYKENDGDYSEWIVAEPIPTISGNTYETTINLTGLNYRSSYTFQARAIDKVNTAGILTTEKKVRTIPVYDWGENDFQFNVDILDKSGAKITNGLTLYEDAGIDPNTTLEHLILTHLNTPCNDFMYIKTEFYGSKTENSNRMQTAFPYYTNDPPYYRYYFNGAWTEWKTQNDYSTSEQIIGRWIDGKPLYRKVVEYTNIPLGSSSVDISNLKIAVLRRIEWIKYTDSGTAGETIDYDNYYHGTSEYFRIFKRLETLQFRIASNIAPSKITVVLEYTKTTD